MALFLSFMVMVTTLGPIFARWIKRNSNSAHFLKPRFLDAGSGFYFDCRDGQYYSVDGTPIPPSYFGNREGA